MDRDLNPERGSFFDVNVTVKRAVKRKSLVVVLSVKVKGGC